MELDPESLVRYRQKLRYKVSYHLGGFCPDIDDVVQETLGRALSALKEQKVHNPDNLGAFLNGVCNKVILEYRRKIWREAPAEEPVENRATVGPEAELLELQQEVAMVLAELSDRDGDILRDFYLLEKDKEDICGERNLTDSQFRVVLFRAKDRFRKIYQGRMKRSASGPH